MEIYEGELSHGILFLFAKTNLKMGIVELSFNPHALYIQGGANNCWWTKNHTI